MGTVIVGIILLLIIAAIIHSMVKDKKNGKSIQCGGDCSKCKGCHQDSRHAWNGNNKGVNKCHKTETIQYVILKGIREQ